MYKVGDINAACRLNQHDFCFVFLFAATPSTCSTSQQCNVLLTLALFDKYVNISSCSSLTTLFYPFSPFRLAADAPKKYEFELELQALFN